MANGRRRQTPNGNASSKRHHFLPLAYGLLSKGWCTYSISMPMWPLVLITPHNRIYLRSSVLRNGLVLADLPGKLRSSFAYHGAVYLLNPGNHDVNFARVAAARNFQSTCDEIFVVTDIKRGVDDPIIKDVIRDMNNTAAVGKITRPSITVICSHAGVSLKSLTTRHRSYP